MEQSGLSNKPRDYGAIITNTQNGGYEGLAHENADGLFELSVLVSGVHCAGCIQKIESALTHEPDIRNARLNFSTHRLTITWEGHADRSNDYVRIIERLGYAVQPFDVKIAEDENAKEERFLLLCLGVAGFAMGNVMLLSVGLWSASTETMGMATHELMQWVSALIALPTILFAGRPFFRSALGALSKGHTNMDVPISLALVLASGMSLFETINAGEHVYFDSAVMLMFFLLVGRYLDFRARKNARSAATDLMSSLQGFANVLEGGMTKRILIRDLKEQMLVSVAAGEKFPVDGHVSEGVSEVDTSLVTGETLPRQISKGDLVYAGTLNVSAPVTIIVAKAAEDSLLSDIVRLMEKAGQGQAQYVRLADKAARAYTPIVHTFSALAFLGWWLVGGLAWQPSLMIAITVLIITCPCALGLAVPVVQVLASAKLMKAGILVKSGDALERLAGIDVILMDKTGTLTSGNLMLENPQNEESFKMAASLAAHSRHPLSCAIAAKHDGELLDIQDVLEYAGQGIEARYQGRRIRLGSRAFCGDPSAQPSSKIELWLEKEGHPPTVFYFTDHLRDDAQDSVQQFKAQGIEVIMLTGDREDVALSVAEQAGIETVYAQRTPPQKYDVLQQYHSQGHKVLMVGDGLNDAPVLAGADVSMAPGTAIDMAQNAADIVFMGDRLEPVLTAYKVARLSQNLVKQNFALAGIYNLFAIPLALGGFVTPLIAALCMSGSSLIVIANSFRLRWGS